MKKILVSLVLMFALTAIVKSQASSFDYVQVHFKDTVVSGDTIYLKAGANIIRPYADSLAALKLYLPTGSTIHDGRIYHVSCIKKVVTLTYLNGTVDASAPNAIEIVEPVTKTGLDGKKICVGGSFSLIYSAIKQKWFRYN